MCNLLTTLPNNRSSGRVSPSGYGLYFSFRRWRTNKRRRPGRPVRLGNDRVQDASIRSGSPRVRFQRDREFWMPKYIKIHGRHSSSACVRALFVIVVIIAMYTRGCVTLILFIKTKQTVFVKSSHLATLRTRNENKKRDHRTRARSYFFLVVTCGGVR